MSAKALLSASVSAGPAVYVEDVFSTYLYTGNSSTQTITNGIDLSGEGGLVWMKERSGPGFDNHILVDTARGRLKGLSTNLTNAEGSSSEPFPYISSFNSDGFTAGYNNSNNYAGSTYASWTFRKAEKFFDVVTYTGTGADQTISHNLGSTPGCIIVKQTSGAGGDWYVYHRSLSTPSQNWIRLNNTGAANGAIGQDLWGPPTSTTFKVDTYLGLSTSSATYVAYLFAHDAGGFGDAGTDSVMKCGSYTGDGTTNNSKFVDLGWEPQWIMIKGASGFSYGSWYMYDNMRGLTVGGSDELLDANTANGAYAADYITPTATGFTFPSLLHNESGATYIYIAIRRGPMKTPTVGTEVFSAITRTGTGGDTSVSTVGFAPDLVTAKGLDSKGNVWFDRIRGANRQLTSTSTASEYTDVGGTGSLKGFDLMNGYLLGSDQDQGRINSSGVSFVNWNFRRAPGFFDVVAYTGTGVAGQTISHSLGVLPELLILKARVNDGGQSSGLWGVAAVNAPEARRGLYLNNTDAGGLIVAALGFGFSSSTTTFNAPGYFVSSAKTYIAYLFATCPGVSKVGSYTGTGATLSVDCGFTAGARFVLIKRTDSTGDWYVWDTARGIISGNDPYLLLNSTAAEVTGTDYIDPLSSGFQISSTAPAAINASGGTYIFLAIA